MKRKYNQTEEGRIKKRMNGLKAKENGSFQVAQDKANENRRKAYALLKAHKEQEKEQLLT